MSLYQHHWPYAMTFKGKYKQLSCLCSDLESFHLWSCIEHCFYNVRTHWQEKATGLSKFVKNIDKACCTSIKRRIHRHSCSWKKLLPDVEISFLHFHNAFLRTVVPPANIDLFLFLKSSISGFHWDCTTNGGGAVFGWAVQCKVPNTKLARG